MPDRGNPYGPRPGFGIPDNPDDWYGLLKDYANTQDNFRKPNREDDILFINLKQFLKSNNILSPEFKTEKRILFPQSENTKREERNMGGGMDPRLADIVARVMAGNRPQPKVDPLSQLLDEMKKRRRTQPNFGEGNLFQDLFEGLLSPPSRTPDPRSGVYDYIRALDFLGDLLESLNEPHTQTRVNPDTGAAEYSDDTEFQYFLRVVEYPDDRGTVYVVGAEEDSEHPNVYALAAHLAQVVASLRNARVTIDYDDLALHSTFTMEHDGSYYFTRAFTPEEQTEFKECYKKCLKEALEMRDRVDEAFVPPTVDLPYTPPVKTEATEPVVEAPPITAENTRRRRRNPRDLKAENL